MTEHVTALVERLRSHFGARALALDVTREEATMEVADTDWLATGTELRDMFGFEIAVDLCGVDYLGYGADEWETTDVSSQGFSRGVEGLGPGRFKRGEQPHELHPRADLSAMPTHAQSAGSSEAIEQPRKARFGVVLHLLSIGNNQRLRVRCHSGDDAVAVVSSLVSVWPGLNWFERETFDMFGIVFDGHPDLRRLLTDYGFIGHPFRKDFPLIGNVEVRYDAEKKRVVYEPVSIEPRVLVPRVIRDDSRYLQSANEIPAPTPNPAPGSGAASRTVETALAKEVKL
jgi:NADH-quinone oxidoreductase subunit C